MLKVLKALFFTPDAYVQVFRNRMVVSIPERDIRVEGLGDFSHPRMLVGKFPEAEQLLARLLQDAYGKSLLSPRPVVTVHPKEMLEGGLTDIEERVMKELALGAGAREAKVWLGEDLAAMAGTAIKP